MQNSAAVRYRLGRFCGWRLNLKGRKVQTMDTTLTRTDNSALPGSQRQSLLDLGAAAPVQSLQLRPGQQVRLQVTQGCLWLTQDGRPEDIILAQGQHCTLQSAGHYRLGAFGQADTQLHLSGSFVAL